MENYCSICGKLIGSNDSCTCLGCGDAVCIEDFDNISGFCVNCDDNYNNSSC